MITVRPVVTDADIDAYVEVRTRVHPDTPMPRELVVDDRRNPDHLDLLAEIDGACVAAASVSKFGGNPEGEFAYLTMRVVAEHRRKGVGTMLHLRASEHARVLGKSRLYAAVRHVDEDSLGYYSARGFDELGRTQDVVLDVQASEVESDPPQGVRVVQATPEHDRGIYQVALEAEADIPSATPMTTGRYGEWHRRLFGPLVARELSVVALDGNRVIGYAIAGRFTDDTVQHWMTGVARAARGRGVARAMKQAQIAAARRAGVRYLRTQNDLANAPMRRVNEKLGYERKFEWIHLGGPLLG